MAPEILRRESYDASVDLWSTGVILYECLFGKPPCSSSSLKELVEDIQSKATIIVNFFFFTIYYFILFFTFRCII